jgi:transcription elongation factor Elf1
MQRKPKPEDVRCTKPKCGGVLWSISSRLAEGLGIITLRCDRCGQTWGVPLDLKAKERE